ncbi:DUF3224 domain-containing protein [Actinosynnema sp. NPDC050436]|uniref:DUF3224 domain-containing protein n=1 Tax=Actinosynnema sp. NPDC050436 TaxID=3155659 RepID=UPI0033C982F0
MSTEASGTVGMADWVEHTWDGKRYDEVTGPKQTTGGMTTTYRGDLEATGEMRFLMSYPDDASCRSTGYEVVTGTLAGRTGTFVLEHVGGFRDGVAEGTFTIVSAGGDLAGLTGTGTVRWHQTEPSRYTLDYDLA